MMITARKHPRRAHAGWQDGLMSGVTNRPARPALATQPTDGISKLLHRAHSPVPDIQSAVFCFFFWFPTQPQKAHDTAGDNLFMRVTRDKQGRANVVWCGAPVVVFGACMCFLFFLGEICPGPCRPPALSISAPAWGWGPMSPPPQPPSSPLLTVRGTKRPLVTVPFVCLTPEQQVRPSKSASKWCVLSLVENRRDCLRATSTRPIVDELVAFLPDLPCCSSPAAYRNPISPHPVCFSHFLLPNV